MANVQTQPKPAADGATPGVQATNSPLEAMERGMPLNVPENSIVEFFNFEEVSKGGQFKYVQERDIPAEVLKMAPYLKGTLRPSLFNEYRGNPGIYLTGQTMIARGIADPSKQMKRFALIIIPL
jgi:hypothetical protein